MVLVSDALVVLDALTVLIALTALTVLDALTALVVPIAHLAPDVIEKTIKPCVNRLVFYLRKSPVLLAGRKV
ncbi:hypothetical protein [Oceanobacillus chungangensis]|uniref:hypothetical protein n=1 Tax=Oceanobacillus chungangensis TaxID=1229152 RepID=UPI001FE96869|nr:hypothetical protein [Oceanobacillus chungangensis]